MSRPGCRALALTLLLPGLLGPARPAAAHPATACDCDRERIEPRSADIGEWNFTPVPETDIYPVYIADPYRSTFALQTITALDSQIPDSGNRRWGLKLGGMLGLVHFYPEDKPSRGWQINLEAGIRGLFDVDRSTDNIAWDGVYSLQAVWRPEDHVAYRFGLHHNSAHVGDEYAERLGRARIDYTREELRMGVAAGLDSRWTGYIEIGWGYSLRNGERQKPWRVQAGLQYIHPATLFGGGFGAYGAVDVSAFEESDWDPGISMQAGISMPAEDRIWRVGVEIYDGRAKYGEFFFHEEQTVLLGLWLDL